MGDVRFLGAQGTAELSGERTFQMFPHWSSQLCSSKQHLAKGSGGSGQDGAWWELQTEESLVLGFPCRKLQGLFPSTGPQRLRLDWKSGHIFKPRGP